MYKAVAGSLVLVLSMRGMAMQTAPSKHADSIKAKVASLAPRSKLSVVPYAAEEEFGELISRSADNFTFFDVDTKNTVTLSYTDVKNLKAGYGGYNYLHHRHTDRTRSLIVVLVIAAGLAALIGAAASLR